MTGSRSKGAWILVAMAAISFASLARVQSGVENARTYADPVIKFFVAAHQADADASVRSHRPNPRTQTSTIGIGLDLLAVFFVGLVAPLALKALREFSNLQCRPAAPHVAYLFQRPPPSSVA